METSESGIMGRSIFFTVFSIFYCLNLPSINVSFSKTTKKAIFKKSVHSTTRSQPGELSHSEKACTGYAGIKTQKRDQHHQIFTQEEPSFNRGPAQH